MNGDLIVQVGIYADEPAGIYLEQADGGKKPIWEADQATERQILRRVFRIMRIHKPRKDQLPGCIEDFPRMIGIQFGINRSHPVTGKCHIQLTLPVVGRIDKKSSLN